MKGCRLHRGVRAEGVVGFGWVRGERPEDGGVKGEKVRAVRCRVCFTFHW